MRLILATWRQDGYTDINFGNRKANPMPPDVSIPGSRDSDGNGVPEVGRGTPLEVIKTLPDSCNVVEALAKLSWPDGTTRQVQMVYTGEDNKWKAVFYPYPPFPSGIATLTIYIDCAPDTVGFPPTGPGTEDMIQIGDILFIDPSGTIFESCTGGPLEDATVRLERYVDGQWVTATTGIIPSVNPQITGGDGRCGWLTSPGKYRIVVSKDGWSTVTSDPVNVPPPVDNLNVTLDRVDGCDFGTLTVNPDPIQVNGTAEITLTMESSGIGSTTVTGWAVFEPDQDVCETSVVVPIPPGGSITKVYPTDFTISSADDPNTGNNQCDTGTISTYTVLVSTSIGDPILKTFSTSFGVVPESIIGAVGVVSASIASFCFFSTG